MAQGLSTVLPYLTDNEEERELLKIKTNVAGYYFDGYTSISHNKTLSITSNPVQYGADISDHAYVEPITLNMTIIMSDVVNDNYEKYDIQTGEYVKNVFAANGKTRSLGAYNILLALQESRQKFDVGTRLKTYKNMMITSINVNDNVEQMNGLIINVQLQEILTATEKTVLVSKRNQTTGESSDSIVEAIDALSAAEVNAEQAERDKKTSDESTDDRKSSVESEDEGRGGEAPSQENNVQSKMRKAVAAINLYEQTSIALTTPDKNVPFETMVETTSQALQALATVPGSYQAAEQLNNQLAIYTIRDAGAKIAKKVTGFWDKLVKSASEVNFSGVIY